MSIRRAKGKAPASASDEISSSGPKVPLSDRRLRSSNVADLSGLLALPLSAPSLSTSTPASTSASASASTSASASASTSAFASAGPSTNASAGPSTGVSSGSPPPLAGTKRASGDVEDSSLAEERMIRSSTKFHRCLFTMYRFFGLEGTTVEQSAISLKIKRLEKQSLATQVTLLEIASSLCAARKEQLQIDFDRIRSAIDEKLAKVLQAQDEVNDQRELHGKSVVFLNEQNSDDDDDVDMWDPAAEASSTVGDVSFGAEPFFEYDEDVEAVNAFV